MKTQREIKFRAWDKNKMMYYPSWSTLSQKQVLVFEEPPHEWVDDSDYNEEIILMQYTGLKDKKGIEIYEGDIIAQRGSPNTIVVFKGTGFALMEDCENAVWHQHFCNGVMPMYIEVIGNIYANPELLK